MVNHAHREQRPPRSFTQMKKEDRKKLQKLSHLSGGEAGKKINKSKSTVNRHRAKAVGNYRYGRETKAAAVRASRKGRKGKLESNDFIRGKFLELLESNRKPAVIHQTILREYDFKLYVSNMYDFGRRDKKRHPEGWHSHLKLNVKTKRGNYTNQPRIKNRKMIDQRDKIVLKIKFKEQRYGDYEMDLMHGSKGCALVIVERKSRSVFVAPQKSKGATETTQNIICLLEFKFVVTITCDNGGENSKHEEVSEKLGAPVYFCYPGHPTQKGMVEGVIGILRRDWPVTTDFTKVTQEQADEVCRRRNSDPNFGLPKSNGRNHDCPDDYRHQIDILA